MSFRGDEGATAIMRKVVPRPWRPLLVVALALAAGVLAAQPATAAEPYNTFLDQTFSASGQQLDLYVPAKPQLRTVIVFIHGGGFVDVANQKETMRGYAQLYAQGGFVTATINYRLAPAHVFPAALEDVQAAVRWLRKHGRTFGYPPPRRIVVIGPSAGGNLALMAGLADRSGIAGIVSFAGPSDLRALDADTSFPWIKEAIAAYLGGQNPDLASPLFRVSRGDPRVLLFQGDRDDLVPPVQAQVLEARLKRYRVPVTLRVFPGVGHEIMGPNPYLGQILTELTQFLLAIDRGHGRPAAGR